MTLTTSCSVVGLVAPAHLPASGALLWLAPIAPGDKVQIIGGQENNDTIWDRCPPLLWRANIAPGDKVQIMGRQENNDIFRDGCPPPLLEANIAPCVKGQIIEGEKIVTALVMGHTKVLTRK